MCTGPLKAVYSIQTRTGCVHLVGTSLCVRSGKMLDFDTQFLKMIEDQQGRIISDIAIDGITKTTPKLKFYENH